MEVKVHNICTIFRGYVVTSAPFTDINMAPSPFRRLLRSIVDARLQEMVQLASSQGKHLCFSSRLLSSGAKCKGRKMICHYELARLRDG